MRISQHRSDALIDGNDLAVGLRSGVIAQHVIDVVGIGPNDRHFLILAQWQCAIVLEQGDGL